MCAPCKVVINDENQRAAELATSLRRLIEEFPPGKPKAAEGEDSDDAMFALAECEVEHILAVRRMTVEHLEAIGVPDRWLALVKKVL